MRTRPICVLCLFLMLGIWAADLLGLSVFRERPLSAGLEKEVLGEQVVVQGILKERTEREENFSICLTHTFLIFHSKKIPINNLKIYMEELVALPLGTQAEIRGILKEIEGPSNPGEFDSKLYCESRGASEIFQRVQPVSGGSQPGERKTDSVFSRNCWKTCGSLSGNDSRR